MSDGPHRSLPMRNHWRKLAERAAKAAYSSLEVSEALPYALHRDILETPLETVCNIIAGDAQGSLLFDQRLAELEAISKNHHGSAATVSLLECAVEAVHRGLRGNEAKEFMLNNTLDDLARNAFRGMEEHYQREGSIQSSQFLREKLDAARIGLDMSTIAKSILSPVTRSPTRLNKRKGIDEGPAI